MKELTIEEKAKAYDEALEQAKRWHKAFVMGHNYPATDIKVSYEIMFPELKESENERIKREIITYLSTVEDKELIPYESWIAWLEKQGEQKINLVEILKHYPKETELYSPLYGKLWLAEVDEENEIITCYKHPLNKDCTRAILEQEDTVSFYSDGTIGLLDFSVSKDCMLFLPCIEQGKSALEAIKEERVQPKQEWSEEDNNKINSIKYLLHGLGNHNFDNWLESLKDNALSKQKWSEEDEKIYQSIMDDTVQENQLDRKQIDWLKLLKERLKGK